MQVQVNDPGFRFGLGIFETILVQAGIPLFLDWHLEVMQKSAAALSLPRPEEPIDELNGEGIWRWFLTPTGQYSWFEQRLPPLAESFTMSVSNLRSISSAWECRYKTMSYLLHFQAKQQAGADEALLLNEYGNVACASMANVFWIREGRIRTPEHHAGCRLGVVRRWVLELSGFQVEQGSWPLHELMQSDEIFVTNSRIGIRPITRINDVTKHIGPLTRQLQGLYNQAIAAQLAPDIGSGIFV